MLPFDSSTALLRAALAAFLWTIVSAGRGMGAPAEETALPTPPRQGAPWASPRTNLPKFVVSATAILCEQGLADPRGCEYRTIHIVAGTVWGQGQEAVTRGWVLPVASGKKPTHAVAWNGLVYPLSAVDEPADLDADACSIAHAATALRASGAAGTRPAHQNLFLGFGSNNEGSAVDVTSLHPIKVCLLLRLGRTDLAELVWNEVTGRPARPRPLGAGPKLDLNAQGLSYLSLARDLAWYHFDRAICAHMRGDDRLALADVRALDALALAVDTRAEAMGFGRPDRPVPPGQQAPYIEFLGQLPEFRDDQERRARERASPPPAVAGAGPRARVEKLVRSLDQVAVRQFSQPGGVFLGQSPIVQELTALGDDAVEPLLRTLRFDDRLTRSVSFHRDFSRNRTIHPVDEAAYLALVGILRTSNFVPPDLDQKGRGQLNREQLADRIWAYWQRNRDVPVTERWYRTLADDQAGAAAWLEAAGNIIQPDHVRTIPASGPLSMTVTAPLKPGTRPRMRGEPLRGKHEPTVAAIMAGRIETMLRTPEGQRFELMQPCQMATLLARWDPVAAVPTLRELSRICRERFAHAGASHGWPTQNLAVCIASFALARDTAGDAGALREYAGWIRTVSPDWLEHHLLDVLEPLHRRLDDPDLAATAAWLFNNPQSPWVPLLGPPGSRNSSSVELLIRSPMMQVPAFRGMLLREFADRTLVGTAEMAENGLVRVELDKGYSIGRSAAREDHDPPARGTRTPVRTCDLYAWELATLPGRQRSIPAGPKPGAMPLAKR